MCAGLMIVGPVIAGTQFARWEYTTPIALSLGVVFYAGCVWLYCEILGD